jgi:hypothetical protein
MPTAESAFVLNDEIRRQVFAERARQNLGGLVHFTPEQRSYYGKASAKKALATRRLRYGPSGRRGPSYDQWRASRGYAPVPDSRPAKLNEQAIDYQI